MGIKAFQKLQLGAEATAGTAVAATTIWRGEGGMLQDTREVVNVPETVGRGTPTVRTYVSRLGAALTMNATPATFEQLPYILEAGILKETPAQDGTGSDYIYEYAVGTSSVNTIRTYTLETGDNQQAEEAEYCFVESFSLTGAFGETVMMSANWIGRQVANTTFTGALSVPTVESAIASKGQVYLDATSGSFGGTAISAGNVLAFTLDVNTGRAGKGTIDSNQLYWHHEYLDMDSFSITGNLVWEHAASAVTEKTNWRNETKRLLRLLFEGSAVASAGTTYSNKTIIIDVPITWMTYEPLGSQNGNSILQANFMGGYDETADTSLKITVVNELSSLT